MAECLYLNRGVDLLIRFSSEFIQDDFYFEELGNGDTLNGLDDYLHNHL